MKAFAIISFLAFMFLVGWDLKRADVRERQDAELAWRAYIVGVADGSEITKNAFIKAISDRDKQDPTVELNGKPDFKR